MVVDIINLYFIIYYGIVLYTMFLFYKKMDVDVKNGKV